MNESKKLFLPEALYEKSTFSSMVEPFSPVSGTAIRFDSKSREIVVDLGDGVMGIIPEEEASIYDFTFPVGHTTPYQISSIIGKNVRAIITGVRKDGYLFLSRERSMFEAWESLQPGAIVDAIVTNVYASGIFVDIGNGIISFVHIYNCSCTRYNNIYNWFKPGDHTFVKIVSKEDNYLVTVTRKEAYLTLEDDSPGVCENDIVAVKISGKVENGYFCEFTPGISGIIDTEKELRESEIVKGVVKKINSKGLKLKLLE